MKKGSDKEMDVVKTFVRLIYVAWILCNSFHLLAVESEKEYPHFTSKVDLRLLWFDELKRPLKDIDSGGPVSGSSDSETISSKGPRTIGLEHLKMMLGWEFHQGSRLTLKLRPDAGIDRDGKGTSNMPIDTRAGDVYKSTSSIQFLDSYQMALKLGPSAELAIGVWEQLVAYETSYSPLLAYGLLVELPTYFSGLKLSWGGREHELKVPGIFLSRIAYEVIVIQGDNDRAEQIGGRGQRFDEGPIARDPYLGGAIRMLWWPKEDYRLSLLFGYGREGGENQRSTLTYGDLSFEQQWNRSIRPVQLNWNARYLLESFDDSLQQLDSLYQFSFSATCGIWILKDHRLLLGAHIGRSERHSSPVDVENLLHYGHQMDLGWDYHFAPGLNVQVMLGEEHREIVSENDDIQDAFKSSNEIKKMLRRFAIAIQYQVDQGL